GVFPPLSPEVLAASSTHEWGSSSEAEARRRSIYVFQKRSMMLPFLELFDGAEMTSTCPKRAVTTIAPQALALFNSAFVQEEPRPPAVRVTLEAGAAPARQVELAYRRVLVRPPEPSEERQALDFLARQAEAIRRGEAGYAARERAALGALSDFCLALV